MKTLFADAFYWVALLNPHDQWHQTAREAAEEYSSARLVTTEAVLVEVLNFFSAFRTEMREAAAETVQDILDDDRIAVVPPSHRTFMDGLEFYEARSDKNYSMVDCMSMRVMRDQDLRDVLTHDQHFEQEGFTALLCPPPALQKAELPLLDEATSDLDGEKRGSRLRARRGPGG